MSGNVIKPNQNRKGEKKMNKLEKSIRHEMKYYGAGIRAGHYGVCGYTVGEMPANGFIETVCADVENGIVTDIRLYTVGDAILERDYYGESVIITEAIEDYIKNRSTWDEMIHDIAAIIKTEKGLA